MKGLKIINILKTFSSDEMKEFEKFIASPYFKKERDIHLYFEILKSYYPNFNSKNFTKEKIFDKLFKLQKNSSKNIDVIFRVLNTELIRLSEDFIAMQTFRNNKIAYNIYLSEGLIKKHLIQRAEKKFNETNDFMERIGFGPDYFKYKYELDYRLEELTRLKDKRNIIYNVHKSKGENIIYFFICEISKILWNLNLNKQQFSIKDNEIITSFLKKINFEEFLKEIQDKNSILFKIISFYHKALITSLKILDGDDVRENFHILKQYYYEIFEHLSLIEKRGMAIFLNNICTEYNYHMDFVKECFEINKFRVNNNLHLVPDLNIFPHIGFKQMLETALSAKEFKWAEKFIENHIEDLKQEYQGDLKNYSYALLYYSKGEYKKALEYISKTDSKEVNFIIGLKSTQIKSYIELILNDKTTSKENEKYLENLLYAIDSCRHFLDNKKLPKVSRDEGGKFLNNVNVLIRYMRHKDNEFELKKLVEQPGISWTQTKAKELLQNLNK